MQQMARSQNLEHFPWVQMFRDFAARGLLVKPEALANEIVTFLESSVQPRLAERRLQA